TYDPNAFKTIARFFDSAGAPVSGEFVVASDYLYDPAVTPLANGGFLIAMTTRDEPAGTSGIKAQAYDSVGNPVGGPIYAGSGPSSEYISSPSAAELGSGLYVIGWSKGLGVLSAQLFTSGGAPVGGQIEIASDSSSESLSLKATPDGGFAAAWWNDHETGPYGEGPFDVGVRFFDSSGAPTGPAILIPAGDLSVEYVEIVPLAGGGYVLGWVERIADIEGVPVNAVKAQLIDSSGVLSGEPLALAIFGMDDDSGPDVSFSAHPEGGFLVTWPFPDLATANFETGQVDYSLNGQLFDSLGQPVGPVFRPVGLESAGSSAILADGTIVATWTGSDSSGSGVYARTFQPANEPVAATDGDDEIYGDDGANTLDGGEGDDRIFGLGGDDNLAGGPGGDLLDGGTGADAMAGGTGNDSYFVDDPGDVVTEAANEGKDEIRTGLAAFSLAGLPEVEYLTGLSDLGQSLTGNGADNIVNAGNGNDYVFLQSGGKDYVLGNQGNDVFLFGASMTSEDQVDGGDGIDQIVLQGNYTGATALYLDYNVSGIENLAILDGSDTRFGDPGTGSYDYEIVISDSVLGEGVQLVIDANRLRSREDLTIDGSAETDGSFFIFGGNGADRLIGGAKNDVFIFGGQGQFGSNDVLIGGDGVDQLALRGNYTITFGAGQLTGIEQIGMVSAQDTRYGALGSSYSYDLTMVDANVDSIQMTVDAAPLRAGEILKFNGSAEDDGSFRVFGGGGNDVIVGSKNGDILVGNGGADNLSGGAGADVFRYVASTDSAVNARDQIVDFLSGTDKIDLGRIDADVYSAGDQAFRIVAGSVFTGAGASSAGELLIYDGGRGFWHVEGDIDGDGNADFSINVIPAGDLPPAQGDFFL
ncbi:MAG TPA: calcium-binding protein, partial [Allosphingosinicella sp.]